MSNILDSLVGHTAKSAETVHDYVQLSFDDNSRLSIYNDIRFDPYSMKIADFVGKQLISIAQESSSISLRFFGPASIIVDMRDQGYRGPEALELHRPGEPPVVWSS